MDPALNVARNTPMSLRASGGYKLGAEFRHILGGYNRGLLSDGHGRREDHQDQQARLRLAMPISFFLGNINAFQLGASSVNPKVETRVVFTGGWSNPAKEAMATNALIDEGVDAVAAIVDSPITVVKTAEKRGAYSVGYHYVGVRKFAPKGWISGVTFTWGELYTRFAKQVMDGTWKSENLNGDLGDDFLAVAPSARPWPRVPSS